MTSFQLELPLTLKPMEAQSVDELPEGAEWIFEPKHDGFRALAFRDGNEMFLRSRNQRPLERYFPEVVELLLRHPRKRFVLDGELILEDEVFETLQLRLHPSAKRVHMLSQKFPATLIAFDLLADEEGRGMMEEPFSARRVALKRMVEEGSQEALMSPSTASREQALEWLGMPGMDGVMAKRLDLRYQPGKRAMRKFKRWRDIDCVVGGLYWKAKGRSVDSLLLGLYDHEGRLHYVGRARVAQAGEVLAEALAPLIGTDSFTGRRPGNVNRWSGQRNDPVFLEPLLVVEVSTDHITSNFMRHGARILRWRTDKEPQECLMEQIDQGGAFQ